MRDNVFPLVLSLLLALGSLLTLWRITWWRLGRFSSRISGTIEVFSKYNGEKILTINHYPQGVSTNHPSIKQSYWYKTAQLATSFCRLRPSPQLLLLGLGANTISSLVSQLMPKVHQTIVEIDPLIIKVCRQFFNLDQLSNYTLINRDAFKLLKKPHPFPQPSDVMIVDLFTGPPPFTQIKSNQPAFIVNLLPHLKTEGLLLLNHPAHTDEALKSGQSLKRELASLFKKVQIHFIKDPRGYRNYVIAAYSKKSSAHSKKSFAHLKR